MATQRQSLSVAFARAGLTAAATLSLARVFSGGAWLGPVLLAAFIPPLAFALVDWRRWHPLVGFVITVVAGAWLAVLVDDPTETVLTIPSASALSQFGHDLGAAPHVLRSATVPVAPIGAALVLAVVATLVAALATEAMARYLEAPIGAIGASVALFVALSALGAKSWAFTTACYAFAVVVYLVTLQHAEVSVRRTWFQSGRGRRSQLAAGGAAAGAAAILIAVTLGPGVPGARGAAWINYRKLGTGSGESVLNVNSPLVSIRAKLTGKDQNTEVFAVETSDTKGYYWRVAGLDRYADDAWGLSSDTTTSSHLDGPTNAAGTSIVEQTFTLAAIDPNWVPAVYRPVHINLGNASVLKVSTSIILNKPLQGATYTVDSEVFGPSRKDLEAVTTRDLTAMQAETELPRNFPEDAHGLALRLTKNAQTPFDKAAALEAYFQSDLFRYDPTVDLGQSVNALHTFLFETHTGFCEQFATAYAELARSIGLPTRVAVGFTRGTLGADGRWHVANRDAHAWPEVWLGPRIGWYAFEPTKSRFNETTGRGDPKAAKSGGSTGTNNTTPTTSSTGTTPTTRATTGSTARNPNKVQTAPTPTTPKKSTGRHVVTGILVALAIAAVLLLAALGLLVFRAVRRTRHRRHDPDPRRRVLGAWNEALDRLNAAGVERRPSATSIEFALRQAPAHGAGAAGPPLMDLARLHTAAMYAAEPPSGEEADAAWRYVDAIDEALRETVRRTDRWKTRLRV